MLRTLAAFLFVCPLGLTTFAIGIDLPIMELRTTANRIEIGLAFLIAATGMSGFFAIMGGREWRCSPEWRSTLRDRLIDLRFRIWLTRK